jgi:succinate-acetate transporter protein
MSEHGQGWADPSPAGLVALALALICFYAVLGGHVQATAAPLVGLWLLGGFVVQLVVALIELKKGATTGGNAFLFFSGIFMLVGGLGFIFKYFAAINKWPIDVTIDGYAWLILALALIVWTPAYLKTAPMLMSLLVLMLDVGISLIAFMDLHLLSHSVAIIPAYMCIIGAAISLYLSAAIMINTAFGKSVLPIHGPIIKPINLKQ